MDVGSYRSTVPQRLGVVVFHTEAIFEVTIAIVLIWFGFPLEFYTELILVSVFVVVSEKRRGNL